MIIQFEYFKKQLDSDKNNVFALCGQDAFLQQKAYEMIEKKYNILISEMNSYIFDMNENFDFEKAFEALNTLPFCSDYKLVTIKNFKINLSDIIKKSFQDYFLNPTPSTILIIKSSTQNEFLEENQSKISIVNCDKLSEEYMLKVISKLINGAQNTISLDGAKKLIEFCCGDMQRISIECEKLKYINIENNRITADYIDKNISKDLSVNIFDLTEAVIQKNNEKAINVLNNFLLLNGAEQQIIGLLVAHFRKIYYCRIYYQMGVDSLSTLLGLKEFAVKKYMAQAQKLTIDKIENLYRLIAEVDESIKTGLMQDTNAVYYLLLKIIEEI